MMMAIKMRSMRTLLFVLLTLCVINVTSFVFQSHSTRTFPSKIGGNTLKPRIQNLPPSICQRTLPRPSSSTTALNVLLDVPDGFFTVTFFMSGILLSLSKNFARVRMEERAWEQRLEQGRSERLKRDPTLTEIDLRRKEAELEWSAYGKPRREEQERIERERQAYEDNTRRSRSRVQEVAMDESEESREYRMTDEEIAAFELEYGVDYDPYYDDPYTEEELPQGKFNVDKRYGDRVYENGEIFYKDTSLGLYYRQGAKPRNLSFWS